MLKNIDEQLEEVNEAISSILAGGQSYRIGSRQLMRANLNELNEMKRDLQAQKSRLEDDSLLGGAYVAVFDRR